MEGGPRDSFVVRGATISLTNGKKVSYYEDNTVDFDCNGENLKVKLHVTDVSRPIVGVSEINRGGGEGVFPPKESGEQPAIHLTSQTGSRRLGRRCGAGLFFLRVVVLAASGQLAGAVQLSLNKEATATHRGLGRRLRVG